MEGLKALFCSTFPWACERIFAVCRQLGARAQQVSPALFQEVQLPGGGEALGPMHRPPLLPPPGDTTGAKSMKNLYDPIRN